MSTTKHTPGPWKFRRAGAKIHAGITGDGRCLAIIENAISDSDGELLAAAPEMLFALEASIPALEYVRKQFPHHAADDSLDVLKIVQAAIAKAKGEV
jgi:hypothetical protein